MDKIAILGGGGFCREVKCLIDDINAKNSTFEPVGYYDDAKDIKKTNGIKYLGKIEDVNDIEYPLNLVVAIADPQIKKKVINKVKNPLIEFPTLIHPSVIKSNDFVSFGKGNLICSGNILTCNILIKDFVTINLSCTIGHDTVIQEPVVHLAQVNF